MADQMPPLDKNFLQKGHHVFLRNLSVDCVIFGFHENQLKVLLLKWNQGPWCLPGGFVKKNESLQDSAVRTLRERTALKNIFLQQFHAFGNPKREKGKALNKMLKETWLQDRFVTIGYYALVEYSKVKPRPDLFSDECKWWRIESGYNLLPEKFTMPELQKLYETILAKPIDRRNFQKKILSLKILEKLKERKTGGAHKAPFLYRFNVAKYKKVLKEGWAAGF